MDGSVSKPGSTATAASVDGGASERVKLSDLEGHPVRGWWSTGDAQETCGSGAARWRARIVPWPRTDGRSVGLRKAPDERGRERFW